GQRDAREEGGARGRHAGVGGGELRFGEADVGPLEQELRWQSSGYVRDAKPVYAAATHFHERGGTTDQQRKRGDVLPQQLIERRNRRALLCHQGFLLGDFERRGRAGLEALLDQGEHAVGGLDVLPRDAQPVLRGQDQEIG